MKKAIDEEQTEKGHARRNTAIGFLLGMLFGGLIDSFTGDYGFATVIGMIVGALIGYRSAESFHLMEYPPRAIRYLVLSSVTFFVSLMVSFYLLDRQNGGRSSVIIALVPSFLGLFFILSLGYAISTLDELQRRIQVEAIAIGFGITALIALTFGLLGLAGTPQPDWFIMMPIMAAAWLIGKLWTRWRYR